MTGTDLMQSRSRTCDQIDTGNALFMTSAFLMACTDVFDEDVLNRKGFTSARNIDAMELSQMLEFRDEAPGDYRRHCLVVIIYLKHKSGISGDEPKSLST